MILELGKKYNVSVRLCNYSVITSDLKFIKVTRTGYNFLNEKTNKCVFKTHFYPNLGFGLSMLGTSISLVGTQQNDNRLIIGGGVVAVIGYFVLAQSHIHIKNAGLLMNQNGVGISIPLNKK